jgi:isopenicillin N synthase-like dioxygenase
MSSAPVTSIPTIDVSSLATGLSYDTPEAKAVGKLIDDTCRNIGFLLVKGHGVRPETKANFLAKMKQFFDEPAEKKNQIAIGKSAHHRGYVAMGMENLEGALANTELGKTYGAGDVKESIDSGTEDGPDHPEVRAGTPLHGPNQLPDWIPGFREAWQQYFDECYESVLRIQRGLGIALGVGASFFEDQPGYPLLNLRMLHYPPESRVNTEDGRIGCGAHTDYGTITVLADDGVGGLQVKPREGDWIDINIPDDHLVVNLADLLAIWTNDRYVSNPHRVMNPPNTHRYSIPLFVTPPYNLKVEAIPTCLEPGEKPKYPPMISGEYLQSRFNGTHTYRNELMEGEG